MADKIPVEVSARHVHLSLEDKEKLFGRGYVLKRIKNLSQEGEFACEETVTISNGEIKIERVRVLGPERKQTQVEISLTDARHLKINPPIRVSGDVKNSVGINLIGPKGNVQLKEGVIVAKRHLHLSSEEAKKMKLKNEQKIKVKINSVERKLIFEDVVVRVGEKFRKSLHLDTDEGNAAGINGKTFGEIVKSKA